VYAQELNSLRSDARGGSFLLAHQQLGALALPTNPTNGQTISLVFNGTTVTLTGKTGTISNPGDFAIQATAALTFAVIATGLRNPTTSSSTFIGFTGTSAASAVLIQYCGYALPSGGTTLTIFSLNSSVAAPLTSFTANTTVTSGTWTAQTMQLYVEDGTYYVGITRVLFLGGSTPTVTAPVSHPRIDVLTIDSSGTLAWTTGTENVSPVAPAYPAAKVPICELYNVVGETALYDSDNQQTGQGYILNDVRPVLAPTYVSDPSQIGSGVIVASNLNASVAVMSTGMMTMWTTTTAPTGFLLCQGQAVSRTTFATLFGVIGSTFGSGDGSTTFNVPDMRGRVAVGVGTGTGGGANGNGLPTGGSALTARSLADWAGEETHLLTGAESGVPAHTHTIPLTSSGGGSTGLSNVQWTTSGGSPSRAATSM
jgi:microcystin-dependent protein